MIGEPDDMTGTEPAEVMEPADFSMLTRRFHAGKVTLDLFVYMARNPQGYEVKRMLNEMRQEEAGEAASRGLQAALECGNACLVPEKPE